MAYYSAAGWLSGDGAISVYFTHRCMDGGRSDNENRSMSAMRIKPSEAEAIVSQFFGQVPDRVDWPGGRSRKTFVVTFDDKSYVVSKRNSEGRAKLEARILQQLGLGGFTPVLLAQSGRWVAQSFIPGVRLSEKLTIPSEAVDIARHAASSLACMQIAACQAQLDTIVPEIGSRHGWVSEFLDVPSKMAEQHKWSLPDFDRAAIAAILSAPDKTFVKWDARPGNSVVKTGSTKPVWIDWEHAGRRVCADDLCWLICDEWFPSDLNVEEAAIAEFVRVYQNDFTFDFERYLRVFGVFHMFVRLSLILEQVQARGWQKRSDLLALDHIGSCPGLLRDLCNRGVRWADSLEETRPLAEIFENAGKLADRSDWQPELT
jgi:hypothetical protein